MSVTKSVKLPAFQFYVGDWRKDIGVQGLDFEHRGVWIEVLCLMHESPERGRLVLPCGDPLPDEAIARNLSITEAEWKQKRSKLLAYGVASQDEGGVLYNRRMVRDEDIRTKRAEAGRKGGKASKPPSKEEANGGSSVSSSSSPSKQPTPAGVKEVFDHWRKVSGHTRCRLTNERRKKIKARLHTYTVEELKKAIEVGCADPFYRGENDRDTRYDFPETLLRNDSKVDQFLNTTPKNGTGTHWSETL